MADRVHPASSPPETNKKKQEPMEDGPNFEADSLAPKPKSGTYVIQIPKDQIYRVPPPENANRFESYSRGGGARRRCSSPCCRCLVWTLCAILAVLLVLTITAAILYFVFRPRLPSYSLDRIAIKGFDLNLGPKPAFSPEFDVTVRADNPNDKVGLYYGDGSDISVTYSDLVLCHGSWPVFYQGPRNVTVFQSVLTGSGVRMASSLWSALVDQQGRGEIPLEIDVKVPVRVKFGAVRSWTVTAKVRCDVVVDKLMESSKIVSKTCSTKVNI